MTSNTCTRFVQNAWKKDFCSNCFKSKEEHKSFKDTLKPLKIPQPDATPAKSIIKTTPIAKKGKKNKVTFPKDLSEVIGFGGDWVESDVSDPESEFNIEGKNGNNSPESSPITIDLEHDQDFSKITKSNTDFNMNINNLSGVPETSIKRSFAALKLGTSKDTKEKKETLKISVQPFNTSNNKLNNKVNEIKQIFGSTVSVGNTAKTQLTVSTKPMANKKPENVGNKSSPVLTKSAISHQLLELPRELDKTTTVESPTPNNSPEIVSYTEKSLLEEISETLEKNKKIEMASTTFQQPEPAKIESETRKDPVTTVRLEIKNPLNKVLPSLPDIGLASSKRPINRNVPITKDYVKPKISVFSKKFDSVPKTNESEESDSEDVREYYDTVAKDCKEVSSAKDQVVEPKSSSFFSSQLISDMFLSNKPISKHLKKHSEVYDLSDGSYGKITSDGLIMTKIGGNDNPDSRTSSNFDSSSSSCSDEETNQRSESDSGIVANEYQNVVIVEHKELAEKEALLDDNFYYDDVNLESPKSDDAQQSPMFSIEKSRELAGEPDGSSDPDTNSEAPALPNSPPPLFHEQKQTSFLHNLSKHLTHEKPKVPQKPHSFASPTTAPVSNKKQQALHTIEEPELEVPPLRDSVELHLEELIPEKLIVSRQSSSGSDVRGSTPKKGRAPDPPPSPVQESKKIMQPKIEERSVDVEPSSIYTRNPMANLKSNSPVVREKDKRERATINPKFRSLNSINNLDKNRVFTRSTTPEPMPRKSLSLSHENLLLDGDGKSKSGKKNKLFSIKKFLRMGSSSTNLASGSTKISDNYADGTVRGDNSSPRARPRLVIIHPIDINTSAVEVVKTPTPPTALDFSAPGKAIDEKVVSGKPPAPPVRVNSAESGKPIRPPPPKSVELRRKQQEQTLSQQTETKQVKQADNVYANLGEVRSAIAPRKPERTASMREREERQLELLKKRSSVIKRGELDEEELVDQLDDRSSASEVYHSKPEQPSSTMAEIKKEAISSGKLLPSKVEIFERNINNSNQSPGLVVNRIRESAPKSPFLTSGDLKNSVQKMSSTIDSYLKDKNLSNMEENPPLITQQQPSVQPLAQPLPVQVTTNLMTNKFNSTNSIMKDYGSPSSVSKKLHILDSVEMRHYEPIMVSKDRMSLPDQADGSIYGGSVTSNFHSNTPKGTSKSFANLPRAISMSYCGSEMGESEIYSPYSFCGSEAGNDVAFGDPQDGWGNGSLGKSRSGKTNRLRMRKGRSVVHKNLEDNYGAVIVANHEALAQVLDQLQQSPAISNQLRPLRNSMNLRFEDFCIIEGGAVVVIGHRVFHSAIWANQIPVTLLMTADCNQMSGVSGDLKQSSGAASGALNPIAEFCDLVPSNYLPLMPSIQIRIVQASISVLPRMYVDTLMSLGGILKTKAQRLNNISAHKMSPMANPKSNTHTDQFGGSIPNLSTLQRENLHKPLGSVQNLNIINETYYDDTLGLEEPDADEFDTIMTMLPQNPIGFPSFDEIMCREVGFVMLQLVNGLKNLQAKGIEEMPLSLSNVILCKEMENKEAQARLCVLQSFSQDMYRDEEEPMGTLCQCANAALTQMLPSTKLTCLLGDILQQERSESLSKIKSVLEFALWGPSDVTLNGTQKEREMSLQRWLDLERATVLHGLVRSRVELTVYDECHLMFLVRSSSKVLAEASAILHNFLDSPQSK